MYGTVTYKKFFVICLSLLIYNTERYDQMDEHLPDTSTLAQLLTMLNTMYRIRAFEEKVDELFMRGEMHGTTHLSIGQEGTAVGAVSVLRGNDFITSTHRGTWTLYRERREYFAHDG